MALPGHIRQFLTWERRVFLGEEEWEFATTRDMAALTTALDERLTRRSAVGGRKVWSNRLHALSVHATAPARIAVFWNWGYWSLFPRLIGGLYFDGHLAATPDRAKIVGRFRHPAQSGYFLLFFANMLLVWLLTVLLGDFYMTGGCFAVGGEYCGYARNGAGVFVGGSVFAVVVYIFARLYAWVSGLGRPKIRALLADIAVGDNPA